MIDIIILGVFLAVTIGFIFLTFYSNIPFYGIMSGGFLIIIGVVFATGTAIVMNHCEESVSLLIEDHKYNNITYSTFIDITSATTNESNLFGTVQSGTMNDTTILDGTNYVIREVNGAQPALDLRYNFSGGTSDGFKMSLYGYYGGSQEHDIKIQVYNILIDEWDTINLIPIDNSDTWYNATVDIPDQYSNNGDEIQFRLIHTQEGISGHKLYIDYIEFSELKNDVRKTNNLDVQNIEKVYDNDISCRDKSLTYPQSWFNELIGLLFMIVGAGTTLIAAMKYDELNKNE